MRADTNAVNHVTLDATLSPSPLPQTWGEGKGEGAVHALHPPGLRDPLVFASSPSGQGTSQSLALTLLRALAQLDPCWRAPADENGLTLRKSALGAPLLLVGDRKGPSLSFSHGKGRLWAAMSGAGHVGIDIAYPEEFTGVYPFHRAFNAEELECAEALSLNDRPRGAALLWAAKEASVKATGAGFNLFDPLAVRVGTPLVREQGVLFEVLTDRLIPTWVRPEGRGWLAVALV